MKLNCKKSAILIALLIRSSIFYGQNEQQKLLWDSVRQLHYKNIDTIFIKNYIYISGDSTHLISQFLSFDKNFGFSINAKDQKFCDTTEIFVTASKYNDKKKSYANIYSTERYSLINSLDTIVDKFDNYITDDNYSGLCKINLSYMLAVDKQWPINIGSDSYLMLYFYDKARKILFEFYYNFNHINLLYYRKIGIKDLVPTVDSIDSVYLSKTTQRLWKKYRTKVNFSEVKELSKNYMKTYKKSSVDQYCILVQFVENGEVCTFMFGDARPSIYKRNFKRTLFYNLLDDLYYPIIYDYGYRL